MELSMAYDFPKTTRFRFTPYSVGDTGGGGGNTVSSSDQFQYMQDMGDGTVMVSTGGWNNPDAWTARYKLGPDGSAELIPDSVQNLVKEENTWGEALRGGLGVIGGIYGLGTGLSALGVGTAAGGAGSAGTAAAGSAGTATGSLYAPGVTGLTDASLLNAAGINVPLTEATMLGAPLGSAPGSFSALGGLGAEAYGMTAPSLLTAAGVAPTLTSLPSAGLTSAGLIGPIASAFNTAAGASGVSGSFPGDPYTPTTVPGAPTTTPDTPGVTDVLENAGSTVTGLLKDYPWLLPLLGAGASYLDAKSQPDSTANPAMQQWFMQHQGQPNSGLLNQKPFQMSGLPTNPWGRY
jgi:hypothetical protein